MSHTIRPDAFDALIRTTKDVEDARLRSDYVGRGMYNSECLALVVPGPSELVRWVLAVNELIITEDDDVAEAIGNLVDAFGYERVNSDQLGHHVVYYWPGIDVEEAHGGD